MKNAVKRPKEQLSKIDAESTWLNPSITTLEQLKDWILIRLGAPTQTVELTDEQLNVAIMDGIQLFSKYHYRPDKYLAVNMGYYEHGVGIDLTEFKIMSVKNISLPRDNVMGMYGDMFFSPYAYFGQGQNFPFFNNNGFSGNWVGSWVTYHGITEFFNLTKEMCGNNPDFEYDKTTKRLKLMPEPRGGLLRQCILLTCQCEPPMSEYFGEQYCRQMCLAEAKIMLGTIRKKFQNITLVGGGQVDTSIGDEGQQERDRLVEQLQKTESKGQCCYIV